MDILDGKCQSVLVKIHVIVLTISGTAEKWIAAFTPIAWAIGTVMKFPIRPPTLNSDTTNDDSSKLSFPVGNVEFSLWSSTKLIVAQPVAKPLWYFKSIDKYCNDYNFKT